MIIQQIEITRAESTAIAKALLSNAFQDLIGTGGWSLTEEEEMNLWSLIRKVEHAKTIVSANN